MLSKNHPIILFIDRNGFGIYQDVLPNIPRFNFTPDLVANLDVTNKDQFTALIATFIQINKMVPGGLVVVLSDDVIYIKDLAVQSQKPALPSEDHKDEVQNFLEDVPFEDVLAKVIKLGQASRVVAVNKDLVMAIINTFVSKGSIAEVVVPGFMYGQSVNFTAGLTPENIKVILENAEVLKSSNMLTDQEKVAPSQGLESELKNFPANKTKKITNRRQYVLVGIFILLLIILGIVYFTMGVSQDSPKNLKVKNVSTASLVQSSPTPVSEPTTTLTDVKAVSITISHGTISSATANNLKMIFSNMGLQNVADNTSETSVPEKSSVIFSQKIPADLRNTIIVEVRKILPQISILESQDSDFTVNIVLGKT